MSLYFKNYCYPFCCFHKYSQDNFQCLALHNQFVVIIYIKIIIFIEGMQRFLCFVELRLSDKNNLAKPCIVTCSRSYIKTDYLLTFF